MLEHELLRDKGILIVTPSGPLQADDFRKVAEEIDACLAKDNRLAGLLPPPSLPGLAGSPVSVLHVRIPTKKSRAEAGQWSVTSRASASDMVMADIHRMSPFRGKADID